MSEAKTASERVRGGWRQWTSEEATEAISAWKASGEDVRTFATSRGISVGRLRRWEKRLAEDDAGTRVGFVEVVPEALRARDRRRDEDRDADAARLVLEARGVTLRVREDIDARRLAELVCALRGETSSTC